MEQIIIHCVTRFATNIGLHLAWSLLLVAMPPSQIFAQPERARPHGSI